MLHDRNSWPTINLPPHVGHPAYQPGHPYAGQLVSRQQPGAFYPPQQGTPMTATQTKPTRGHRPGLATGGSGLGTEFSLEEEDTTSGDLFDNITPRDISRMRYRNHHEWMEEVLFSSYPIDKIAPVDLGLGRKGDLESVTSGFFYTPSGPANSALESKVPAAAGKMEPKKAEEFADAVSRKIAAMTAEMEAMRKKHDRAMNKIRKLSVLKEGELRLREAVVDPSNVGPEFWRIEGRLQLKEEEVPEVLFDDQKSREKVDDIARGVFDASGKSIAPVNSVVCVEKGGWQEKIQPAQPPTSTNDTNMSSNETAQQQNAAPQAHRPPGSDPAASGAGASGVSQAPHPTAPSIGTTGLNVPQNAEQPKADAAAADVQMGGMQEAGAGGAGDQAGGDWVMVNKNETATEGNKPEESNNQTGSADATTTAGAAGNGGLGDSGMLSTGNFEDVSGFNSAGEALAAYGEQNDSLDLGGLDNSAFGDAFHAPEAGEHVHHDQEDIP